MHVLSTVENKAIIVDTSVLQYSQLAFVFFFLNCWKMESLLCNEVWLMSPDVQENDGFNPKNHLGNSSFLTKEDFEEAFRVFLVKESRFLPEPGYLDLVKIDYLTRNARFKAVNRIIKTQRRMDLSLETVFIAVNYLDRFISLNQCHGWKCWMYELLSVSCLSVASKFNETTSHLLYEFQMDQDLKNYFAPTLIQRMELTLLKALGWRMNSTTPFSYIDLMIQRFDSFKKKMVENLTKRVTDLLLKVLLDHKFLEFKQCVIAMSAIKCVLEEDLFQSVNNDVIPQEHKDNLINCQIMMEQLLVRDGPSSPVTVLKVELFNSYDFLGPVETKSINMDSRSNKKRKREKMKCEM